MSLEPQKHLEKALAKLHSAKILLHHGMYDDAASRAYYAMFHSAKALLSKMGISPKSHEGVVKSFGEHLVKTGILPKALGEKLRRAKDLREKGDYSPYYTTPEDVAKTLVEDAEEFYASIKGKLTET